ncbi:extracellular solute-binding protein [Paenibacillus thermotolerans]|uniref:extracellular solute-binding protein n=1 Tax=Paenibacillus thermotolerans TaxID=3027807 RepID=UPI002367CF8E|nr:MULTISPECIES: extracellular solute-binding protein [unclassified Paenibacillus]
MKKTAKVFISFVLLASLTCGQAAGPLALFQSGKASAAGETKAAEIGAGLLEENYSVVLQEWGKLPAVSGVNVPARPVEGAAQGRTVPKADSFGYHADPIRWDEGSEINFEVNVAQTGLYRISFDYYILDKSILPTEGYVKINGEYPYYESRRIVFRNLWKNRTDNLKLDRYGNELIPRPEKADGWQKTYAYDASFFHMEPLLFKLEAGKNIITLVNTRGGMLLGDVAVESPLQINTYEQYLKKQGIPPSGEEEKSFIVIEGEDFVYKNDSSIRPVSETESALTPYDTQKKLLNIIDGASWAKGGQSVTWELDIPKSGYYHIGFKYKQDEKYDLPVFRMIEIDGKVPFAEVENYPFAYGKKWRNETLGSRKEAYRFYLEQGKHTLTATVNLSNLRPLAEAMSSTMKDINSLTLQIQKLTGNKKDAYRDWSLSEYIPDLEKTLIGWAERLEQQHEAMDRFNPNVSSIGEISNLTVAAKQLRKLAKEPDELPNRLNLLSQGSSSVSQLLGDLLQRVSESPMSVDKVYVYQNYELPSANAGFFKQLGESVKRFFLSFGQKQYSIKNADDAELQVWVNRPRQFVELMQKMIDEQYTPETGVQVQLSVMPDENKLILANSSGDAPDVALGVNNWIPYELAIRGAVMDLRKFDDFPEVMDNFAKGAIIPFAFEDGVYAIPETQNFWVLFYRKDIMESLKLPVPSTWDDVVDILPELQRLGMNFYEPNALFRGFKPFVSTTPFIYQFGGELFAEDGMSTAIDSEEALEGIRFMTDLYTIYNLPQDVPNFYHHFRYGTMPIGISDFATYIQLRTAAPEIANWWSIALHPGVEKNGEVARWAPGGGQTGMIFDSSDRKEEGWSFLKWWMSTNVQIEYANMLQTTFGETYMWNTANLNAFEQLPWPEEDKKVILEQIKWMREPSRVPGAYMVEREISNVWNKVVFDGDNPRTTIDDSVIKTNREIKRKMEEFDYYSEGKILKPYPVPTIQSIDKWVE